MFVGYNASMITNRYRQIATGMLIATAGLSIAGCSSDTQETTTESAPVVSETATPSPTPSQVNDVGVQLHMSVSGNNQIYYQVQAPESGVVKGTMQFSVDGKSLGEPTKDLLDYYDPQLPPGEYTITGTYEALNGVTLTEEVKYVATEK